MNIRMWGALLLCCLTISPCLGKDAIGEKVFGLTKVLKIHLAVSSKDYAAMEPPSRQVMFPPTRPGMPKLGDPDFGAGNLGYEFEYVSAKLETEDQTFSNIGLRYKGSGTYLMSQSQAKRSFKIDFDEYGSDKSWDGLTKLNLNSGVMDPTKAREVLAYSVFRTAGVPAPRTAFAEVTLTVPGKFDKEYLGLYTVVEQIDDKHFLKTHFGDNKGLLLKPEGIRGLPYFGDDPEAYHLPYNPKSKPGRGNWQRLVEFTRLVNRSDDAEFNEKIATYLDVDLFVRFLAANTMLASLDGFMGLGHNYYIYQSPTTGKFVFLPWDLDLSFGAFAMYGSADQLVDLSIDHPHLGENKLIDRLLDMPDVKSAYQEHVRRLATTTFTDEQLLKDLAGIENAIKNPIDLEKQAAKKRRETGGFGAFGGMFQGLSPRDFIKRRVASVTAQLAAEKTGYVPQMMAFGPGGFGAAPPRTPSPLNTIDTDKDGEVSEAEFAAGMKDLFMKWDSDKNGRLDQSEIAKGVQTFIPRNSPR
jgi:spore coat protein H